MKQFWEKQTFYVSGGSWIWPVSGGIQLQRRMTHQHRRTHKQAVCLSVCLPDPKEPTGSLSADSEYIILTDAQLHSPASAFFLPFDMYKGWTRTMLSPSLTLPFPLPKSAVPEMQEPVQQSEPFTGEQVTRGQPVSLHQQGLGCCCQRLSSALARHKWCRLLAAGCICLLWDRVVLV